jgi:hypothetical protein
VAQIVGEYFFVAKNIFNGAVALGFCCLFHPKKTLFKVDIQRRFQF